MTTNQFPEITMLQDKSIRGLHPIAANVTFEWVEAGQIAVFSVKTISRQSIDLWMQWMRVLLRDWTPTQPYLVLYDFSDAQFYLTSYIRKEMKLMLGQGERLRGREAFVVPHTFLADIVRSFVRRDLRSVNDRVQRNIFYERKEGLEWLQQAVDLNRAVNVPRRDVLKTTTGLLVDPTPMIQAGQEDTPPDVENIAERGTDQFPETGILLLEAVDLNKSMRVFPRDSLILGRDYPADSKPDIDLVLWAGYRTGVSRRHAKVVRTLDGKLQLYDLVSLNGTFLNGEKLEPYKAYTLHDGDMVRLGRLLIRIRFQHLVD